MTGLIDIKGLKKTQDAFGADYWLIDPQVMSKRKAWNYLLSIGFERCPNKAYLKRGEVYAHDNKLHNWLKVEFTF